MEKDQIDASLGLAFSLTVFERYRKSGLLQADLHGVPGVRGRCRGHVHLVEGKVVACYLKNMGGQRQPVSMDMLIRWDSKKGPFEWSLTPLPPPPQAHELAIPGEAAPRSPGSSPIPKRIALLDVEKLEGWTHRQKRMLSLVFDVIDGQRTVEVILTDTPLPPTVVEEALRILLAMKVIIIPS